MKRIGLVLVLLAVSMAVFANGTAERGAKADRDLDRTEVEEITISGTVEVTDDGVLLETTDGTYNLHARGGAFMDVDAVDGETAEVTGLLKTCDGDCEEDCDNDYDGNIMVLQAQTDDESFDFTGRPGINQDRRAAQNNNRRPNQDNNPRMNHRGPDAAQPQGRAQGNDPRANGNRSAENLRGNGQRPARGAQDAGNKTGNPRAAMHYGTWGPGMI